MGNAISLSPSPSLFDVNSCPAGGCGFTISDSVTAGKNAILAHWNSGCVYAPLVGTQGSLILSGNGGHSSWGGNETYIYDIATNAWSRRTEPFTDTRGDGDQTVYPGSIAGVAWNRPEAFYTPPWIKSQYTNSLVNITYGEFIDGTPLTIHTYDHPIYVPPNIGWGVGASGGMAYLFQSGVWPQSNSNPRGNHVLRFDDFNGATKGWHRIVDQSIQVSSGADLPGAAVVYDTSRNRGWVIYKAPGVNYASYLNAVGSPVFGTITAPSSTEYRAIVNGCNTSACYDSTNDWILVVTQFGLAVLPLVSSGSTAWVIPSRSGVFWSSAAPWGFAAPATPDGFGVHWIPSVGKYAVYAWGNPYNDGAGGTGKNTIFWITPAGLTGTWDIQAETLNEPIGGIQGGANRNPPGAHWKRFMAIQDKGYFLFFDDLQNMYRFESNVWSGGGGSPTSNLGHPVYKIIQKRG